MAKRKNFLSRTDSAKRDARVFMMFESGMSGPQIAPMVGLHVSAVYKARDRYRTRLDIAAFERRPPTVIETSPSLWARFKRWFRGQS